MLRAVFLFKGYAYVHESELKSVASTLFRRQLSAKLDRAHSGLPKVFCEQRLAYALTEIASIELAISPVIRATTTRLKDAHFASYPPCMRILHTNLLSKGHLKHFGRLQLALFLKGIGLTVEENLSYWKVHFQKFDSSLLYNIRHIYGQEGKKRPYEPWTCDKIISLRPA